MVCRRGARPGDAVYVSGTLGDSALALRMLLAGQTPDPFLARRHHDPKARTGLGRALAQAAIATAMIDVSDGLLADLGHILEASQVGAEIAAATLPLALPFQEALAQTPTLLELALSGGEDYELLFTVPPQRETELGNLANFAQVPITRIGRITSAAGELVVRGHDGRPIQSGKSGYDHFG
jgi:thiamine-monophosphate kinase